MLYRNYIGVIFPHPLPGASMEVKPPNSFLPEKVLVPSYTGPHVQYHSALYTASLGTKMYVSMHMPVVIKQMFCLSVFVYLQVEPQLISEFAHPIRQPSTLHLKPKPKTLNSLVLRGGMGSEFKNLHGSLVQILSRPPPSLP